MREKNTVKIEPIPLKRNQINLYFTIDMQIHLVYIIGVNQKQPQKAPA